MIINNTPTISLNGLLVLSILYTGGLAIISGYVDGFFIITLFTMSAIIYSSYKLVNLIKQNKIRKPLIYIVLTFNIILTIFSVQDHIKFISYSLTVSNSTHENTYISRCIKEEKEIVCTDIKENTYKINK